MCANAILPDQTGQRRLSISVVRVPGFGTKGLAGSQEYGEMRSLPKNLPPIDNSKLPARLREIVLVPS